MTDTMMTQVLEHLLSGEVVLASGRRIDVDTPGRGEVLARLEQAASVVLEHGIQEPPRGCTVENVRARSAALETLRELKETLAGWRAMKERTK